MPKRIGVDNAYLNMALMLAQRSTCLDKRVGCILTNKKNEIIATGYNGSPRGMSHCCDLGSCNVDDNDGDKAFCPSAHAEQNALLQCRVPEQIHSVYVTLSPCLSCVRILMNTPAERIIFLEEHRHPEARLMWGKEWLHIGA